MLKISESLCKGCGQCISVCPHQALALEGNPAKSKLTAPERCMECGACGLNCQRSAIAGNFGVGCFACMTKETLTGKSAGSCAC